MKDYAELVERLQRKHDELNCLAAPPANWKSDEEKRREISEAMDLCWEAAQALAAVVSQLIAAILAKDEAIFHMSDAGLIATRERRRAEDLERALAARPLEAEQAVRDVIEAAVRWDGRCRDFPAPVKVLYRRARLVISVNPRIAHFAEDQHVVITSSVEQSLVIGARDYNEVARRLAGEFLQVLEVSHCRSSISHHLRSLRSLTC